MSLPTVKVVNPNTSTGYMIINQSDYEADPEQYELYSDQPLIKEAPPSKPPAIIQAEKDAAKAGGKPKEPTK